MSSTPPGQDPNLGPAGNPAPEQPPFLPEAHAGTRDVVAKGPPDTSDSESPAAPRPLALQPVFDSTAPAALSQPPGPREPAPSRAGVLAAAGLAALTLIGVGWRVLQPTASGHDPAQSLASETTGEGLEASETADSRASAAPLPRQNSGPPASEATASGAVNQPSKTETESGAPTAPALAEAGAARGPETVERQRVVPPRSGSKREASTTLGETATAPTPSNEERQPTQPREAVPGSTGAPDLTQVAGALARAASRATSCGQPGGPSGHGSVRVVLNPAGGVLNATVTSAPFAGSNVGSCIESTFRRADTAPYQGRSLTTVYQFSVPQR